MALLKEVGERYRQERDIVSGQYLHVVMLGVSGARQNQRVDQNLLRLCLHHAASKGDQVAVAEATGTVSQHILQDKFGFVPHLEVSDKKFAYRGKRIFASIEGHGGTVLMDRAVVLPRS